MSKKKAQANTGSTVVKKIKKPGSFALAQAKCGSDVPCKKCHIEDPKNQCAILQDKILSKNMGNVCSSGFTTKEHEIDRAAGILPETYYVNEQLHLVAAE